jgi:serine/threonine protein kinase
MGVVYKAEHLGLKEARALKVMASQLAADPKFVERFRKEAQSARRLQHVNAVHVDDYPVDLGFGE